jgi:DNA polymerase I-like protein with 3'-5' exonuclease and polymerase domains
LDDDILNALPYPEAKPLAEYMLIKKRLGQIADGNNAWLKLVNDETGCMHGDVITNGCITGRCAHRNPNMGQVPASYSDYGKECRSLFHAPEGWTLIGVDAKALELRCLAGYLAYWDNGEYARVVTDESIDIHTYNQEMFSVPTRDISKRLLYGLLYGCGALKAGTIIDPNEKDETVLRKLGSTAINSFMQGIPALKELKDRIAHNIAKREHLIGLDGRPLFCRSDFKGLNVLLQSSGALIMKQVVIELHKKMYDLGYIYGHDWQQHGMIHDEIQVSCPPEMVDKLTSVALDAFPASQQFFGFQCPIEGDAHVGCTWFDTH